MASEEDLAEVMRNALEYSGDLALLHVQLEEKVAALKTTLPSTSQSSIPHETDVTKPTMPSEVFLVNELIREYLRVTGCNKTATVFTAESSLPADPMSAVSLRKAASCGRKLDKAEPLLCTMVDDLLKNLAPTSRSGP